MAEETLGAANVVLGVSMRGLRAGLGVAHAAVVKSAAAMGWAFSNTIGRAWRGISNIISGVFRRLSQMAGLGGAGLFGGSIYAAVQFERQMAKVSTMLNSSTMPMVKQFSREIRELAKQSGEGTKALSDGLYAILSASVPADKAMGVLAVTTRAAIGGMTDTGTATKALVGVLNAYAISADKAEQVSDVMFAGLKAGQFEYSEMAQSLGDVISIASQAGLSFQELIAALATMTRQGIQFNEATTAMVGLSNAVIKQQDEARQVMKDLGIEINVARLQSEGLLSIIKSLDGATIEQVRTLGENVKAFRALAALAGDVKGFELDIGSAFNSTGKAMEAHNKMADTTYQKLKRLKEKGIDLLVTAGEWMLDLFERMKPAIGIVIDEFGKMGRMLWDNLIPIFGTFGALGSTLIAGFAEFAIRVPGYLGIAGMYTERWASEFAVQIKMATANAGDYFRNLVDKIGVLFGAMSDEIELRLMRMLRSMYTEIHSWIQRHAEELSILGGVGAGFATGSPVVLVSGVVATSKAIEAMAQPGGPSEREYELMAGGNLGKRVSAALARISPVESVDEYALRRQYPLLDDAQFDKAIQSIKASGDAAVERYHAGLPPSQNIQDMINTINEWFGGRAMKAGDGSAKRDFKGMIRSDKMEPRVAVGIERFALAGVPWYQKQTEFLKKIEQHTRRLVDKSDGVGVMVTG